MAPWHFFGAEAVTLPLKVSLRPEAGRSTRVPKAVALGSPQPCQASSLPVRSPSTEKV